MRVDGLVTVNDQLAGVALPASTWESLVLPARLRDYSLSMLDELTTTGEVLWSGRGELEREATAGSRCTSPTPRR